jgi:hypothetical protein
MPPLPHTGQSSVFLPAHAGLDWPDMPARRHGALKNESLGNNPGMLRQPRPSCQRG